MRTNVPHAASTRERLSARTGARGVPGAGQNGRGARACCYLDNPAGTQVPLRIAQAVSHCFLETNANLGGYFKTSVDADEVVASARTGRWRVFLALPQSAK